MGAFHSGEFEGLWSRFPGLKLLYPATAQETFEALVAGFLRSQSVPGLRAQAALLEQERTRSISTATCEPSGGRGATPRGRDVTLVAFGAMVHEALAAADEIAAGRSKSGTRSCCSRWTSAAILESVRKTGRLLVVQECGRDAGAGRS